MSWGWGSGSGCGIFEVWRGLRLVILGKSAAEDDLISPDRTPQEEIWKLCTLQGTYSHLLLYSAWPTNRAQRST